MTWIKTESGSFLDTSQQVPWKNIIEDHCNVFLWSCILYYKFDTPVLSDIDFDFTEQMIEKYYDDTPEWFKKYFSKGNLKTEAHSFIPNEKQIMEALKWKAKFDINKMDEEICSVQPMPNDCISKLREVTIIFKKI